MGEYRDDDEALIGLARQLTDAYGEARTQEDQDYACEAILDYLGEYRRVAPSEALLALLDLPLTAETFPLVDEAQTTLSERGPAVVELLLSAALGRVYDPDGPAPERAAETLDSMAPGEASLGLVEVLCGDGDGELKDAAVDALVALGGVAEPDLVVALGDLSAREWARAALAQLRYARENPDEDAADDWVAEEGNEEESVEESGDGHADGDDEGEDDEGDSTEDLSQDDEPDASEPAHAGEAEDAAGAEPAPGPLGMDGPATSGGPAPPDQDAVDGSYEDFLRRFEQESGTGSASEPPS